jgi:penicillin-binding protein 1A
MLRLLRGVARTVFVVVVIAALAVGGAAGVSLWHFSRGLPGGRQLIDYIPAVGSKVYDGDGRLLVEFEKQHRIPVTLKDVPPNVIHAFLAAEDRDFYKHGAVNPAAIIRAAVTDIERLGTDQRPIGASTITQQVVRHFLLTNRVSLARKIREMILAYRIERALSKARILEIYLNEIYLGAGAYGVAAAADTYFQKPLDNLTLAEAAFLAALPKSPSNYDPLRHPNAAKARRDWVLSGMQAEGWITAAQAKAAAAAPLRIHMRTAAPTETDHDGYFVEEVRKELIARFGEKAVYRGGLSVRTSFVPAYQQMAETAFRDGLLAYDRRHGWRGPVARLPTGAAADAALAGMKTPPGIADWRLAAVAAADYRGARIVLKGGGAGFIPRGEERWARRDRLRPGDIVLVERAADTAPQRRWRPAPLATYALRQIPKVSGGVVAMDPKTGRVLAIVGGWSFRQSQFDRAVQAMRQPGSSFKPFVYVTALEHGFTPDSVVDDAPVSIPQGPGKPPWRPANYEAGYVGPTTLDDALVNSRNLATVNLALQVGLTPIAKMVEEFGVLDKMPRYYSMVLGAGDTTLLRLTAAYSMLDNGGHWLSPSLIDAVQDRGGNVVYQKGVTGCAACFVAAGPRAMEQQNGLYRAAGKADPAAIWLPHAHLAAGAVLYRPTRPDPLVTPEADVELLSMMQDVVRHGTGIEVAAVDKPLAGKTGTTNDWRDAWFVGFSPDLTAGVYVGFDEPKTLGRGEAGGRVAAPIFRDFMAAALNGKPATPFPVPSGAMPKVASTPPDASAAQVASADPDASADAAGNADDSADAEANAGADDSTGATASNPESSYPAYGSYPAYPRRSVPTYGYWPDYARPPQRRSAPPPSQRDYAAAQARPYPPPWKGRPGYDEPGYGGPPPGYPPPGMPGYPPPGWTPRPGDGTGGLY